MTLNLRDRDVKRKAGAHFVVPKGMEHKPVALKKVELLMIDAKGTLNTGNLRNELTVEELERV